MDLSALIRPNILTLKPYSSARNEYAGGADVYLDANESPFPTEYNRYPDPLQNSLKDRISKLKDVPITSVFLGNGSDEAIDLLIRACCEPGRDKILITEPTYGMYKVCADINNSDTISVPLTTEFELDVPSIKHAIDNTVKVIFFCSPNNPTGNTLSLDSIIEVVESFTGLVVIDEAYIDFSSGQSFTTLLTRHSNIAVLQTFSKAWGLAGIRLGMCFANPELIAILNKIKYPYNISTATQLEVAKMLDENNRKANEVAARINQEKERLIKAFEAIPMIKRVFPSDANFLLVEVENAEQTYRYLAGFGIIVRDRSSTPGCTNCLRITIGTSEENNKLLNALKSL